MSPGALWLLGLASALVAVHMARDRRRRPPDGVEFDNPFLATLSEGAGWAAALIVTAFAASLDGLVAPFIAGVVLWYGLSSLGRRGLLRPISGWSPAVALIALATTLHLFQAVIGDRSVPALENLMPD